MVTPTTVHADGSVDITHDGHAVTVAAAHVQFARTVTGTPDLSTLVLPCPTCGATSYHPAVGDGACREAVQRLAVRTLQAAVGGRTFAQAKAIHRVLVQQRWGAALWVMSAIQHAEA